MPLPFEFTQVVLALLLFICLVSYGWGMCGFFHRPGGVTPGMRVITLVSAVFALVHLTAILLARPVSARNSLIAALLYVCALALYWWAILVNRKAPLSAAFSPDVPVHLVQRGPYRLVRHPFYSSYLLMWSAGVFAGGQWWLLGTVGVMTGIYLRAALGEEKKFSNSPLANTYIEYRRRTGLLMPNPLKLLAGNRPR